MPWYKDQNGKPTWVDDAAPRAIPIGPQNPTYQYQGPKAATDLEGSRLGDEGQSIKNNRDSALSPLEIENQRLTNERLQLELEKLARDEAANNPLNSGSGDVKREALKKLADIDTIRQKMDSGIAPVGGLATPLMAAIPGTDARDISTIAGRVTKAGALSKILDMTRATGKNPFTPMSNSDVQLIADTEGNLDQGNSPDEFRRQLDSYQDAYVRAYAGAAGNEVLGSEIDRQFQKYLTENPRSSPAQRKAFRTVLETQARKNYDKRLSGMNIGGRQQRAAPAPAATPKFLGFE